MPSLGKGHAAPGEAAFILAGPVRPSAAPTPRGGPPRWRGGGRLSVLLEHPFCVLLGAQLGAQAGIIIVLTKVACRLSLHHELDRCVLAEAEAFENEGGDFIQMLFVGHDGDNGVTGPVL